MADRLTVSEFSAFAATAVVAGLASGGTAMAAAVATGGLTLIKRPLQDWLDKNQASSDVTRDIQLWWRRNPNVGEFDLGEGLRVALRSVQQFGATWDEWADAEFSVAAIASRVLSDAASLQSDLPNNDAREACAAAVEALYASAHRQLEQQMGPATLASLKLLLLEQRRMREAQDVQTKTILDAIGAAGVGAIGQLEGPRYAIDTLRPPNALFRGRSGELASILDARSKRSDLVIVEVVAGPGLGKSWFIDQAAEMLRPSHNQYILIDVPDDAERGTAFALESFREQFGLTGSVDVGAHVARLSKEFELLLVIDNAERVENFDWMRRMKRGTIVVAGKRPVLESPTFQVRLHPLPPKEATAVVAARLEGRNLAESHLTELALACEGHPLVLGVVTSYFSRHPHLDIRSASRLLEQQGAFEAATHLATTPEIVTRGLGLTYSAFDSAERSTFVRLASVGLPWITAGLVESLTPGFDSDTASDVLDSLASWGFLQPGGPGLFSMHGLVNGYGRRRFLAWPNHERIAEQLLQAAASWQLQAAGQFDLRRAGGHQWTP